MDEITADCGAGLSLPRIADCGSGENDLLPQAVGESSKWGFIQCAIGYLLAAAGLIWVLHDFQLGQLRSLVANLEWRWIALAVVCDVTSYLCQGARWRLLLKPLAEVSTLRATQAIYAGLFTNEILPMRLGELVRAYLVARWTAAKLVAVIPSMVVERLFDGIWLAAGIGLTAMFVPLPKDLLRAADALGTGVVVATAALAYVILRPPKTRRFSTGPLRLVSAVVERLLSSLQGIARTREFYLSLGGSLLLLICQAMAFWLVMLGCGLHLSFWIGVAVFLIVHLGTAIPNAPANVGTYQFFTVVGLTLFGVDKSAATGFSLVVFLLLTLPLLVLGFVAMSVSGTGLLKIRGELRTLIN